MVIRYHDTTIVPNTSKIFIGRIVHSKSLDKLEIIPHGAVTVAPDGTITSVVHNAPSSEMLVAGCVANGSAKPEIITLKKSQFLFPGMIDTHLHAPQWPNLALGMEGTLQEWLKDYTDPMVCGVDYALKASYKDNDKARRVYADVVQTTLKLGSTTVAYNSSIHTEATNILADACLKAGQRAHVGRMSHTLASTSGNQDDSISSSLAGAEASIKYIHDIDPKGRLLHASVQPRGGPFCPPELMQGLGELCSKHHTSVQAHMCETQDDVDRTLALHTPHKSYTAMYQAHNLLHPGSILAHCIHLSPADLANLRTSGAGVAHCPNSNTCLRDGECHVRTLLSAGVTVGLGTDCSAGYMPNILDAMRSAANVSRNLARRTGDDKCILSFSELVYLATMGGARVVGLQDVVGNFEEGKKFDALVVEGRGVISADAGLWEDGGDAEALVKKWVFLGDDRTICRVYVDGRWVAGHDLGQ